MKPVKLFVICCLFSSCTNFFFRPSRYKYSDPKADLGVEYKDLFFKSYDGTRLHGWHLKSKSKRVKGLVLFFHGNAENVSSHYRSLVWLTKYAYDVLIVDYRGYGLSGGESDVKGVYEDSLRSLEYAVSMKKKHKFKKLILYGQSLGGVIASRAIIDSKHRSKFDLLVLDSTFSSYNRVAFDMLSNHWFSLIFSPLAYVLVSDKYGTHDELQKIKLKTLVVHGTKDRIVPYNHGLEIFEELNSKKWLWTLAGGKHIQTFHGAYKPYRQEFLALLNKL